MNLTIRLFGREVLSITIGRNEPDDVETLGGPGEPLFSVPTDLLVLDPSATFEDARHELGVAAWTTADDEDWDPVEFGGYL